VDVILFEGWNLGFPSVRDEDIQGHGIASRENLRELNENLRSYAPLFGKIEAFVVMEALNLPDVYSWREEAEEEMRKNGHDAMSKQQVISFVDRYMPAYLLYTPHLLSAAKKIPTLQFTIGHDRSAV